MSAAPKRSRMNDDEAETALAGHETCDPVLCVFAALRQAREDRKRLAEALKWLAPFRNGSEGAFCWCHPDHGPCFANRELQDLCRCYNAILCEVDP